MTNISGLTPEWSIANQRPVRPNPLTPRQQSTGFHVHHKTIEDGACTLGGMYPPTAPPTGSTGIAATVEGSSHSAIASVTLHRGRHNPTESSPTDSGNNRWLSTDHARNARFKRNSPPVTRQCQGPIRRPMVTVVSGDDLVPTGHHSCNFNRILVGFSLSKENFVIPSGVTSANRSPNRAFAG